MSNILLFGGGLQSLSLARGLVQRRHRVHNIGDRKSVGKYSKFITKFQSIDLNIVTSEDINRYVQSNLIDVIIPTEDEYAEWLSLHKQEIKFASCAIVDPELFAKVINKSLLLDVCKKYNIPHPRTIAIETDKLEEYANYIGFPALIKPDISNGSRGISLVNSLEELKIKAPQIIDHYGTSSLQEYIHNPSHYYNAMLYRYSDGSYSQAVVTKITRFYPIRGGSSSFCTTIDNPFIIKICKRLLEKLNWNGFADFDILEKGLGDYRIIEINPRVPASLHAALVSGIDFGEIIVADMMKQSKPSLTYYPGRQLRFLGLDIAWFLASPKRFHTHPSWFKFFGKHLYYQEGGIADIKAMGYSIWSGVKKQFSPSFRKSKSGMN